MPKGIYRAARIFDGVQWHEDAALRIDGGRVAGIGPAEGAPLAVPVPGWIVPGLIDLQVNGGGGVLFNNDPTLGGIARICAAHAAFGTTATMVTLITDRPEVTAAAISAGGQADATPGFLGLHLEGPHLAVSRKGTHDPALIRPMAEADLAALVLAAGALPNLIVTLAPEAASALQIGDLAAAGAVVSLGHSNCDAASARAAFAAGAGMVTHLFNAMSQLGHRAPGLVGAALDGERIWAGLIADGFHVDDTVMRVALRAKAGAGRSGGIFLVSDAMSTIGSDQREFTLNGRRILREGGRLTLQDGTLAGADIALIDAVRHVHRGLGLPLEEALRLAALHPARAMGLSDRGHLAPGARADFIAISPGVEALGTWIGGLPAAGVAQADVAQAGAGVRA
ncbi:N-acetylglucosamine-6-phosphate deacetylase [Pseudogemmobacter sonorensis]|uniref:N-acetylglucosamine-6-phosphate deacetylase n=1 Tax=Pseudogemmobacter sonorensis TaxID=2989681 RepID=UPI0036BCFA3B